MKKSFKIAIAAVLLLLTGGAGSLYYFLNVKEYEVADKKVEEITKADYQIDLPDLDGSSADVEGSVAEGSEEAAAADGGNISDKDTVAGQDNTAGTSGINVDPVVASSKGIASTKSNDSGSDSESPVDSNTFNKSEGSNKGGHSESNAPANPIITAETIKAAYRPAFESLQAQANAKIDALVNSAYGEYQAKKQNGESVSITYFYRKYTSAGKELESNTDETFTYMYDALVKDLEEQGFSRSDANEFKIQYENAKSARESALIEKAKSAL